MARLEWDSLDPAMKARLAQNSPELAEELAKERKVAADFQELLRIGERLVQNREMEARLVIANSRLRVREALKAQETREEELQVLKDLREQEAQRPVPKDYSQLVRVGLAMVPVSLYISYILFG